MTQTRVSAPTAMLASFLFSFIVSVSASTNAQSLSGLHAMINIGKLTCMTAPRHAGYARTNSSKRATVQAAVRDWSSFTALEYGQSWSNFRYARARKMACSRHGSGWSCKVNAGPCRRR